MSQISIFIQGCSMEMFLRFLFVKVYRCITLAFNFFEKTVRANLLLSLYDTKIPGHLSEKSDLKLDNLTISYGPEHYI